MSGRASVKSKGAEIFFGDDRSLDESDPHRDAESTTGPVEALTRAHPDVSAPASELVRQDATESGRDETSEFLNKLALPSGLRRKLWGVLRKEHRFYTAVWLSREDTAALRDVIYELEARMGIRLPRSELIRLVLRLVLEDYAVRKEREPPRPATQGRGLPELIPAAAARSPPFRRTR